MSRTLRRAIAPAAVIIGLLAVPSAALAAPANLSIDSVTLVGTPAAGDIAQYDVTLSAADVTASNDAHLTLNGDVVGTTTITGGATLGASSCTGADCDFATGADASGAPIVVHYHVQLPQHYETAFSVSADLNGVETDGGSGQSTDYIVTKGGPSTLVYSYSPLTPAAGSGVADKWITKGGTLAGNLVVKNYGAGAAYFVSVHARINDANASEFSPSWGANPPFDPVVAIVASGACAITSPDQCDIATIPAGGSVSVPVQVTGLTHYGNVDLDADFHGKADNGPDDFFTAPDGTTTSNKQSENVQITDGISVEPLVAVNAVSKLAAGNTNVVFNGELSNNGPQAISNGVVNVAVTSFDNNGDSLGTHNTASGTTIPSLVSITMSNGATCVPATDHSTPAVAYVDVFRCPITSLAANARLTFQVTAKFATAKEATGSVSATFDSTHYISEAAQTGSGDSVRLNLKKYTDLEVSVASAALIGADRATVQTVTITNKGTDKASGVYLTGSIYSSAGTFDTDLLPTNCTGITKPQYASCSFGTIEAGATKTIAMPLHAGSKLGSMSSTYMVDSMSFDANFDNNTVTQVVTIVKANAVPLLGVIVAKAPAQAMAKVAKTGVKSVVTVPGPATVKVDLIVTAKVAQTLGLVKAPKKSTKKAKKAPAFYTIGTSTTKVAAAGKVTTTTKLTKKYVKKLLAAKKKFAVKRTITVVSTAPKTAGASSMTSQTLTFTPAKKKKGKK